MWFSPWLWKEECRGRERPPVHTGGGKRKENLTDYIQSHRVYVLDYYLIDCFGMWMFRWECRRGVVMMSGWRYCAHGAGWRFFLEVLIFPQQLQVQYRGLSGNALAMFTCIQSSTVPSRLWRGFIQQVFNIVTARTIRRAACW